MICAAHIDSEYSRLLQQLSSMASRESSLPDAFALLRELIEKQDARLLAPRVLAQRFGLDEAGTLLGICIAASAAEQRKIEPLPAFGNEDSFPPPVFRRCAAGWQMHPAAVDFLLELEPDLPDGVSLELCEKKPLFHDAALVDEITRLLEKKTAEQTVIMLRGSSGSGRKFLCSRAASELGGALLLVDGERVRPQDAESIALLALLYGAFVCLDGGNESHAALLERLLPWLGVVFITVGREDCPPPVGRVLLRDIDPLTAAQRRGALETLLPDAPAEALEAAAAAPLEMGRIAAFAGRYQAEAALGFSGADTAARLLREQGGSYGEFVRTMQTSYTLNDLILPEEQSRALLRICAFARAGQTVFDTWGFGEKVPYGRGISALFYGASGAGKTMAACAVANELGLELLRVDLSRLMSKYVGETQKNIVRVFESARGRACVLFFDEADALFSRRGEAGDAGDKHANAEIACLLQETERYEGITLLATNLLQNFDEAFRRRISFMLHFPIPDEERREMIWRGIFPGNAPLDEIDYRLLAREFELSGGAIKNCAVYAACRAASEHGKIDMPRLIDAAMNEYTKLGKKPDARMARRYAAEGGA